MERRGRGNARPQSGHRAEPHHAAPVACFRFFGRRLPAGARCRRSARRARHAGRIQHADRAVFDRAVHHDSPSRHALDNRGKLTMKLSRTRRSIARISSVAAIAAFSVASSPAWSQSKTIYIGMNGGPMEKAYTSQVLPDFEKANNVKVVVVPGTSSDVLAKLLANRNS